MDIYREILPESYLLILADELPAGPDARPALGAALRQAIRSGKPSIWIDCSHLHCLAEPAAALLTHYGQVLARRGISLLLCHLHEAVEAQLRAQAVRPPLIVPTLLDAQHYCRQRVNRPAWALRLAG